MDEQMFVDQSESVELNLSNDALEEEDNEFGEESEEKTGSEADVNFVRTISHEKSENHEQVISSEMDEKNYPPGSRMLQKFRSAPDGPPIFKQESRDVKSDPSSPNPNSSESKKEIHIHLSNLNHKIKVHCKMKKKIRKKMGVSGRHSREAVCYAKKARRLPF